MTDLGEDRFAVVDGVRLHYVEAGAGPLVVLIHGFPEFWYSWRYQMPPLAAAGFRVVALDMRGYNLSDKPKGIEAYRVPQLAADIAGLIRALGEERASVVGHDWGGGAAWGFAMAHPAMLDRLVLMNAPHPVTFLRSLRTWRQLRRSWYMFFFQLPRVPEAMLSAGGHAFIHRTFGDRRTFSRADVQRYVEAISRPGALTAGINYYRAAFQRPRSRRPTPRIDAPTLVIWGMRDVFLGPELAQPDPELVPNARVERIADASHWVQQDRPELVNEMLIDFLAPVRAGTTRTPATTA